MPDSKIIKRSHQTMNTELAEKLVRQLADAVAELLPTLKGIEIQPETRAAISRLLFAISHFGGASQNDLEQLEDGRPHLSATALKDIL